VKSPNVWGLYKSTRVVVTPAKQIPAKTIPHVINLVPEPENISVLNTTHWPIAARPSDKWMNLVFSMNFNTRVMQVYNDGKLLLENLNQSAIPLTSTCTLHFGQQTALTAEVILSSAANLTPNSFGCYNSQKEWVPKKFDGALAVTPGIEPLSNVTPTSL
jgi:hypothetical protein